MSIRHQPTSIDDVRRITVHRGQSVVGREFGHSCAVRTTNMLSAVVSNPSACSLAPASNAAERSSTVRTSWICSVSPSEGAASFNAFTCNGAIGSSRYVSTSTREIPGSGLLEQAKTLGRNLGNHH